MEEYVVLLTGRHKATIEEFFFRNTADFKPLSVSMRYEDLKNHVEVCDAKLVVLCLGGELQEDYSTYAQLKDDLKKLNIPVFIVGTSEDCNKFIETLPGMAEESFSRPFSIDRIHDGMLRCIREREDKKRREEEEETAIKAAEEAAKIEAMKKMVAEKAEQQRAAKEQAEEMINDEDGPTIVFRDPGPAKERKHVLVIDDDPLMLKVVKEQLRGRYDVAAAVNGRIAYKFLESKKTDMILLDYEMPIENGKVVLENIRKMPGYDRIPVVFLTGVNDSERIREVLDLNPQGYLLKPIEKESLISAIKKCIGE